MKRIGTVALLAWVVGLAGCSARQRGVESTAAVVKSEGKGGGGEKDAAAKQKELHEKKTKIAKLNRELPIAKEEVAKAKLAVDIQTASNKESIERAQVDRDLAERKLRELSEKHAPVRLDRGRLDLQNAKDWTQESEEELAQLEIMYKESDLADKTREIVIQRAKRRLESSRKNLELKGRELDNLEKATLPTESEDLRLALLQKAQALDSAKRQADADLRGKKIELMKAESEVVRIEAEIADVEKELKP